MRKSPAWLSVSMLSGVLCAQRYVVDAGGAGDFIDLPAAVVAVPEGATLLVRPGSYAPFALRDKSLTIVAEAQPCIVKAGPGSPVTIADLSAGKRVLVCGLAILHDLVLANDAGTVVVQGVEVSRDLVRWTVAGSTDVHLLDVTVRGGNPSLEITDSSVEVTRCLVDGFGAGAVVTSTPGGTAVTVTRSRLWVAQSVWYGGDGGPARAYPDARGGEGGTALRVAASDVQIHAGTRLRGGTGGFATFPLAYPGAGGNGIEADAISQVTVLGGSVAGGTGGFGFNGSGQSGKAFVGPVTLLPGRVTPSLTVTGTLLPNETMHLQLAATPDSVAVLVVGLRAVLVPQPFLQVGASFVTPEIVLGPFTTDASGKLDLPVGIPAAFPGAVPAFVQFASLDIANASFGASGSAVLIGRY